MGKKIDQSKRAKEHFYSPLIEYLRVDLPKSRSDISSFLAMSDREARKEISEVSLYYPVISNSGAKGYRLAKKFDKMSVEEAKAEIEEVQHVINELQSRIKHLKAKQKPLIAYIKSAEKHFNL